MSLFHSIGSRLFIYVLGSALVGLGSTSYFFFKILHQRVESQIQQTLNTQVILIENQLARIEESTRDLAITVAFMKHLGMTEADVYKQLVLKFFQKRPSLIMGTGFGQNPYSIVADRQWYWPYFYFDEGYPDAIGERLPAPNQHLRYAELFTQDNYPSQNYYREPIVTGEALWTEPYDWYGITMTSFLTPLFDSRQKIIGVAGSDVSLSGLRANIKNTVIQDSGYFIVLNRFGTVLSYPPDPEKAKQRASYQQIPLLQSIWKQLPNSGKGIFHQGDTFLVYQWMPSTQWVMLAALSHYEVIFKPVFAITAGGTLIAGIVLMLVVIIFVRRLNERLQPILKECRQLAEKYRQSAMTSSEPMCDPSLQDELDVLTQAFNQMTQQLKESFTQLKRNETQLRQFLEAVPIGIFIVDAKGQPYYLNQAAQQILGKGVIAEASMEQLPEVYQAYVTGTDDIYPSERQPVKLALRGEKTWITDMEIRQSNCVIPIETWGTPILDDHGQIIHAIVVLRDITAQRRAELERSRFVQEIGDLNEVLTQINQAYERFVPRRMLNLLGKDSIIQVNLGDQVEREMTILFADIRGFTSISEQMTPLDVFEFINNYLGQMEPIILAHHGIIDKYIGDAIMAVFPSANDAVNAALTMLATVTVYNRLLRRARLPPLYIGIGLNTGPVMVGTIGGFNRMDGTVLADAVNTASRVEGLTKIYQASLLLTETTYQQLEPALRNHSRVLDIVKVRGKSAAVTIYEIYKTDDSELIVLKEETRTDFEQGFRLYHEGDISQALPLFEQIVKVNSHDKAAQIYLIRCQEILGTKMLKSAKILIVDDTVMNVKILSHILTSNHFEVLVAENGEMALQIAAAKMPHLILLDVMMPGMDGFETCLRLQAQPSTKDIPVMFMTGLADKESKIKGFDVGAVDYLTKPFHREEVLARIKVHLSNLYLRQNLRQRVKEELPY
jgi:PAS domain S-box-containing protein